LMQNILCLHNATIVWLIQGVWRSKYTHVCLLDRSRTIRQD
jgi:hypothetical protein